LPWDKAFVVTNPIERPVNVYDAERPAVFAYRADPPEYELDNAEYQVPLYLTVLMDCWTRRGESVGP
jgi:hypothetical protein